jgi:hypothetical protein
MILEGRRTVRAFATALAVAVPAGLGAAGAAAEAEKALEPVLREQIAVDRAAVASQDRIDEISDETQDLLIQYRQYLAEAQSLREYSEQLGVQVASQVEELDFLRGELEEIDVTARGVMPLMGKMLDTLERFVALDVPFQLGERSKRIAALKEMMARADVSISEKYRRIVEAYQIETEYGRTLEAYAGELGEGEAPRTVRFLRLGRVALLYQTLDGKETGYWDAGRKAWVVDPHYRHAVKRGYELADKIGAPDLLTAPVPAPVESGS